MPLLFYELDGETVLLDVEDYYVQTELDGQNNTLSFTLPIEHTQAADLRERRRLVVGDEVEGRKGQIYTVSAYNKNGRSLSITAELDLTELRGGMVLDWTNGTATLASTITAVLPAGWTLVDHSGRTDSLIIEDFCGTPLEYIEQALDTWQNVAAQFDNVKRTVTLYATVGGEATGTYFTTDLNLTETPSIKGKAEAGTYYNRLYLRGKDGLALPSPGYVENRTYDSRIVSAYKEETDIETQSELLAVAQQMVDAASVPDRSYTCKVVDLAKCKPKQYAFLTYGINDIIVLLDPDTYSRSYQRITRVCTYPHYPEKSSVVLAVVPGTISNTIKQAASRAALARKAAQMAQKGADNASSAAKDAKGAADEASSAAKSANEAADDAMYEAKHGTVSGSRVKNSAINSGYAYMDLEDNYFEYGDALKIINGKIYVADYNSGDAVYYPGVYKSAWNLTGSIKVSFRNGICISAS